MSHRQAPSFSTGPETGAERPLLLWLGPPYFSAWLPAEAWRVRQAPYNPERPFTFTHLLQLTGGETPAVIIIADSSRPPWVLGTEAFPCLTLFYAVDSHLHSWYPLYAQGMDACMVSLRDDIPLFSIGRLSRETVWWFPPFALDDKRPPATQEEKIWDLLFVGTLNPQFKAERVAFFQHLQDQGVPLHAEDGDYPALFPKARVLFNEAPNGDLNFRTFEALGCGGCLLTPAIGHGLEDLFTNGEHLALYPQNDVPALKEKLRQLLDNPGIRQRIAAQGLAEVDARHRASHRAMQLHERLADLFRTGEAREMVRKRLVQAPLLQRESLRMLYLHWAEEMPTPEVRSAYLAQALGSGQYKRNILA